MAKYDELRLTDEESAYEMLWILDRIFTDAESGEEDAILLYNDIINVFNKVSNRVLNEYVSIQTGKSPMCLEDHGKSIVEVIGERLSLNVKNVNREVNKSIKQAIELYNDTWLRCLKNKYSDTITAATNKKKEIYESRISDESYYEIDYKIKYLRNKKYEKRNISEIEDLLQIKENNSKRLEELRKIKTKTKKEKKELNSRIKMSKQINDDLEEYGHHIERIRSNKIHIIGGYNEELGNAQQEMAEIELESGLDNVIDEYNIEKIKLIAEEVLSPKQYIIFNLYYFGNLKQVEIAEITGENKNTITKNIQRLMDKIIKMSLFD